MEKHAFHSRTLANQPRQFPLLLPDGTSTPHYFQVVFEYSDKFEAARREFRRMLTENAESKHPVADFASTKAAWLLSHAVVGWSFDEPCTQQDVEEFLTEAPHILKDLDDFVYNKARFFAKA